ncbi:MAG: MptD family putative ECF transporter S component [Chloroflexota bacterium]
MELKLGTRDLIMIGIFTAVYLIAHIVLSNLLVTLIFPVLMVLIAEGTAYLGRYKSFLWNVFSYVFMSVGWIAVLAPNWFAKEWMRELTINSGYSTDYADGLLAIATPLNLGLVVTGTVIGAIISSQIAHQMLKKRFIRASIA